MPDSPAREQSDVTGAVVIRFFSHYDANNNNDKYNIMFVDLN